ncbi:MAG: valine--tRNA ligase [Alphaproteobacteria bacterium]|nr:valine--tRNA ligase [Alphaproteobacteria bacterium]MBL0717939.1 valine--tRNA ligase [Alphaproteobacteria bacterium]
MIIMKNQLEVILDRFEKLPEVVEYESEMSMLWTSENIYAYSKDAISKEIFSMDTPPPYANAKNMHIGHVSSYTQADFIARYERMNNKNVFYPAGWDDNGLPTEVYIEKQYGVSEKTIGRKKFKELCIADTQKMASSFEGLFKKIGLSTDFSLRYTTIDKLSSATSQKSFRLLYDSGHLEKINYPSLWDTKFESAISQSELEVEEQKSILYDIDFSNRKNLDSGLVISTTRPELIFGCVSLYANPKDDRYSHLKDEEIEVPLTGGRKVKVRYDEEVDIDFGSGLMMVCTFGDSEDVRRWKRDDLETITVIDSNGRLNENAMDFVGLPIIESRKKIVGALEEEGRIKGQKKIKHMVSMHERSRRPVEYILKPQWSIKQTTLKEDLLAESTLLEVFPAKMKNRLDDWIKGLSFDWVISRQRSYGVPIPVWYCVNCDMKYVAEERFLPVDPSLEKCPLEICSKCGGKKWVGEKDVLDTWMTSSCSPLINSNWVNFDDHYSGCSFKENVKKGLYPMSLRPQGRDIIRTWLYYTILKSMLHTKSLPFKEVYISGMGLDENGKKISKRDIEKWTDKETGYNKYYTESVVEKLGADSIRFWASSNQLGNDLLYSEKEMKMGRKTVVKLWNSSRFILMMQKSFYTTEEFQDIKSMEPKFLQNKWILSKCYEAVKKSSKAFENRDFFMARKIVDDFFWNSWSDIYLEVAKNIFAKELSSSEEEKLETRKVLIYIMRQILNMYAPILPFITEYIYQLIYSKLEEKSSIHKTSYIQLSQDTSLNNEEVKTVETLIELLKEIRSYRTENKLSHSKWLDLEETSIATKDIDKTTISKWLKAI